MFDEVGFILFSATCGIQITKDTWNVHHIFILSFKFRTKLLKYMEILFYVSMRNCLVVLVFFPWISNKNYYFLNKNGWNLNTKLFIIC